MNLIEEEVSIKHYTKSGWGLALASKNVEVFGAVDGDQLLIVRKKGKRQGRIKEILHSGPNRVETPCPYVGECGGCTWQQIAYSAQLTEKQRNLEYLLRTFINDLTTIYPIIACEDPWRYRNKMEFSFSQDKALTMFVGLSKPRSQIVVNLDSCMLVSEWFTDLLKNVREWAIHHQLPAYHSFKNEGLLRTLTIREARRTGKRMIILGIANFMALSPEQLAEFKQIVFHAAGPDNSIFLQLWITKKGQPTKIELIHLNGQAIMDEILQISFEGKIREFKFPISPSAFFQPNPKQAELLYGGALELTKPNDDMIVYDLYCGLATIGQIFAPLVKKVIAIEQNAAAIANAHLSAKENGITNIELYAGDVDQVLASQDFPKPDLIIVDPPRAGLGEKVVNLLLELNPAKILYISCNPASQALDLELLLRDSNYRLHSLQAVDQFPHTVHIENMALCISSSISVFNQFG